MKSTKFGFMKITAHAKASQVLTPILMAIAAIGLILGLSACGSGAVGAPPDTTPVVSTPLAVSPATADLFPDVPTTFTVTGGKPGYTAFSSNSVALPVTATLAGATFTVIPGPVTAETAVDITVRDTANASASAKATVKPSTLINQITFTPSAPTATGCGTALCSGNDAQVVVKAALNGVVLRSRQIRFDAFQGNFQIVTPGTNLPVNSLVTSTDEQGEAVVKILATAGAPTQVATLQISDVTGGQTRKFSFNITQQISGVGVLSTLPSAAVVIVGERGVIGVNQGDGKCPVAAQVDYLIFGGTPPYSVASSRPDVARVADGMVPASGGRFSVNVSGCGQAAFIITDATGRTIQTAIIDSQRGQSFVSTSAPTSPLGVSPLVLNVCPNSSASVSLSGFGSFASAIITSIPNPPSITQSSSPSSGVLPATITFTRTNGPLPTQVLVNITDGKTTQPLSLLTPVSCP